MVVALECGVQENKICEREILIEKKRHKDLLLCRFFGTKILNLLRCGAQAIYIQVMVFEKWDAADSGSGCFRNRADQCSALRYLTNSSALCLASSFENRLTPSLLKIGRKRMPIRFAVAWKGLRSSLIVNLFEPPA